MSERLTGADAEALRQSLSTALAALPGVGKVNGYPVYPPEFGQFTDYIYRSPWHRKDYTEDMKEDLRGSIELLSLGKIRSLLTLMIRIDRFSPGGLLGMLKDGTAERVVSRAQELVEGLKS